MSSICFVRVDTQDIIASAPMADWWMVTGELQGAVYAMDHPARAKLLELISLGKDFRKPPRQVVLTEMDIVDWYGRCSLVMIRLLKQVGVEFDTLLLAAENPDLDMSKLWSHKASTAFVELLALNSVLLDARCSIEAREIRIPMLKVI